MINNFEILLPKVTKEEFEGHEKSLLDKPPSYDGHWLVNHQRKELNEKRLRKFVNRLIKANFDAP